MKQGNLKQGMLFKVPGMNLQKEKEERKKTRNKVENKKKPPKSKIAKKQGNTLAKRIEVIKANVREMKKDADKYEIITTEPELARYMIDIYKNNIAAIDTETNSLDPILGQVVGFCFYTPGRKAVYVPTNHTDLQGNRLEGQLSNKDVARFLEAVVNVKWIFHNAKFDYRFIFNSTGLKLRVYWDTQIAAKCLNENEDNHKLKPLHAKYVLKDVSLGKEVTFDKLFDGMPFNYVPIEDGYIYAAGDAIKTFELYEFQYPFLTAEHEVCQSRDLTKLAKMYHEIEMEVLPVVAEMENAGVEIDNERAKKLSTEYNERLKSVEEKINAIISKMDFSGLKPELIAKLDNPVNIGSPTQLAIIIYDLLGIKSPNPKMPRGTGAPILEELVAKKVPYYELFELILEHRGLSKLIGTYIDKMPQLVNEKTGRLHGSFHQYGAKTGRFSSSDPNLQNIPSRNKEIRKMFKAADGNVIIGCDYSQQEPRVLAHLTWTLFGDSRMKDAYAEGRDLYSWMASEIYQMPYDECKEFRPDGSVNPEGKKRRSSVKSIILGLMYGRGTKAIADQLGWTYQEAQRVTDMFFKSFPAIKDVIDYYLNMARSFGYVETVYGRKRRLPEINLPLFEFYMNGKQLEVKDEIAYFYKKMARMKPDEKKAFAKRLKQDHGIKVIDNGGKIAEAERQCLNSVIQGSSADITKKAMIALHKNKRLKELGYFIILTVHDEVLMEGPEEHALEAAEIMSKVMIEAPSDEITVPMKCDSEIVRFWYGDDITNELKKKQNKIN